MSINNKCHVSIFKVCIRLLFYQHSVYYNNAVDVRVILQKHFSKCWLVFSNTKPNIKLTSSCLINLHYTRLKIYSDRMKKIERQPRYLFWNMLDMPLVSSPLSLLMFSHVIAQPINSCSLASLGLVLCFKSSLDNILELYW